MNGRSGSTGIEGGRCGVSGRMLQLTLYWQLACWCPPTSTLGTRMITALGGAWAISGAGWVGAGPKKGCETTPIFGTARDNSGHT